MRNTADNPTVAKVVTIKQAATFYTGTALTPSAIRRLVVSGEIPSRRIGSKYLIVLDELEKWLRQG